MVNHTQSMRVMQIIISILLCQNARNAWRTHARHMHATYTRMPCTRQVHTHATYTHMPHTHTWHEHATYTRMRTTCTRHVHAHNTYIKVDLLPVISTYCKCKHTRQIPNICFNAIEINEMIHTFSFSQIWSNLSKTCASESRVYLQTAHRDWIASKRINQMKRSKVWKEVPTQGRGSAEEVWKKSG